jgi:hypothetical protein
MRALVTTALEVVGAACVTVGAAMFSVPAGFIVGGVALVVFGYQAGGDE